MSKENAQTQQRIEDLLGKTVEYYDETSGELARGRVKRYDYHICKYQVLVMPSGKLAWVELKNFSVIDGGEFTGNTNEDILLRRKE